MESKWSQLVYMMVLCVYKVESKVYKHQVKILDQTKLSLMGDEIVGDMIFNLYNEWWKE